MASFSSAAPQILSKNALSTLITSLDASDVLECYHLTRHAPLAFLNNDDENSTTPTLSIPKSAIGIRFQGTTTKSPLQLTLEYGPQRFGIYQTFEATPHVISDTYVAWQNEAKVYYFTNQIYPQDWESAYYMASITGAVLEKLLSSALEYVEMRSRYQPFVVVSEDTQKTILRSSSSGDFLEAMWQALATLGVAIQPILPPPVYIARLHITGKVTKYAAGDTLNENGVVVSQHAALFYSKLEKCVAAIATGDYSAYESHNDENDTSVAPSVAPGTNATDDNGEAEADTDNETNDEKDSEEQHDIEPEDDESPPRRLSKLSRIRDRLLRVQRWIRQVDEDNAVDADDTNAVDDTPDTDDSTENSPSQAPSPAPTTTPTVDQAQEANKAAQEAKAKAHEAKEAATTDADNKAADAAEAAANAAQKAADATSHKQQQQLQSSLLSGDGILITSAVGECFSNPRYQLQQQQNNNSDAIAFLYLDGATYYQLNLTTPYMDVVKVDRPIPTPPTIAGSGGGDFVDWTLACFTILLLVVGIVLVFQRIGFKFLQPLYKLQKWFFSPTSDAYDSDDDEENLKMGQGFEHAFGEDVIPFSMGGRRPHNVLRKRQVVPIGDSDDLYDETTNEDDGEDGNGHVEMVIDPLRTPVSFCRQSLGSQEGGTPKRLSSGRRGGPIIMDLPERLARDPDLVDLPNLSSKSKVAVPVAIERQQNTSRDASDNEDGDEESYHSFS